MVDVINFFLLSLFFSYAITQFYCIYLKFIISIFSIYVQSKDEAELGNLGKTQLQDSAPMGVS